MKLTAKEKTAYGLGAVGKDMVYMLSASYILYYYQDILGVSAIAMGIILLVARIFDAFNDPIMGVVVAKTKTRWGKFRPWLLIGTVTNAIILFLMFSAPPTLNGSGLVAYAAVTYILWGVTYTMMDIPYWSMIPAFTEGGKERENLSALARTCAGVGSAIVTIITVMAVTAIGTAVSNKNSDNLTVQFASDFGNVTVNIIEIDDADAATGNELLYRDNITLSVTADSKEFEEAIDSGDLLTYSEKNSDYEIKFDDITINADNSIIVFETDTGILDGGDTTTLKVWVDSEEFAKLDKTGGLSSITGTFTSTKEVERYGFKYFALIVAILFVVFVVITCLGIKEKSTADMKTATIGEMFKALIQNDQAMTIVITIVLINIATYITSNLLIYFFKYDLAGSNWQGNYTLFNTFAGGIQILSMMIIFPVLRKFFTTIKIFNIAVISSISGYVVLLVMALAGTSSVYPFLIPGFFIMAAVGVLNVLVTIFLANTVDYGELKNGRRDESVIFSMQTFVVKLASGIAALVASICLSISNISDDTSTVGAAKTAVGNNSLLILRLTMTLLPIFGMIIAIILFRKKYILDEKKLDEITTTLKEKVNDKAY